MGTLIRFVNAFIDGVVNGIVEVGNPKPQKRMQNGPQNFIEISIQELANTAVNSSNPFTKDDAAKRIFAIVNSNWNSISEGTKSYAVQQLSRIANSSSNPFTKDEINDLITKIAIGRPKKSS